MKHFYGLIVIVFFAVFLSCNSSEEKESGAALGAKNELESKMDSVTFTQFRKTIFRFSELMDSLQNVLKDYQQINSLYHIVNNTSNTDLKRTTTFNANELQNKTYKIHQQLLKSRIHEFEKLKKVMLSFLQNNIKDSTNQAIILLQSLVKSHSDLQRETNILQASIAEEDISNETIIKTLSMIDEMYSQSVKQLFDSLSPLLNIKSAIFADYDMVISSCISYCIFLSTKKDNPLSAKDLQNRIPNETEVWVIADLDKYNYYYGNWYRYEEAVEYCLQQNIKNAEIVPNLGGLPVSLITNPKDSYRQGYVYRVQMMATVEPLSENGMNKLKKLSPEVVMQRGENGWYKYFLGKFNTWREADLFRQQKRLYDTYIVEFEDK